MKKILCIIRVSTDSQDMESQKTDMLNWLTTSLKYSADDIYWLESAGASARSVNEKYIKFLDDIKRILTEENINTIAMFHLNRLARKESQLQKMKEFFVDNHIQVYIKNPSITLLDENGILNPAANLAFSIFGAMVSLETEEMFAKMKRGKDYKRAQGFMVDGGIPYGMKLTEDKKYTVDEEKGPHVIHLYKMYAEGASVLQCRDYLHSVGFMTVTNHIGKMLHNKRYKDVVGIELYDAVQSKIAEKTQPSSKERSYQLGLKLIICPKCNAHYIAFKWVYACVHKKPIYRGTDYVCDSFGIAKDRMNCILVECAWRWFDIYTHRNGTVRLEELKRLMSEKEARQTALINRLKNAEQKTERLAELYADGMFSREKYLKKKEEALSEKTEIENEIKSLNLHYNDIQTEIDELSSQKVTSEMTSRAVDNMTKVELYELVHKFIEKVELGEWKTFKEIRVYSRFMTDESEKMRVYRFSGTGTGYHLYLVNPHNYEEMTEVGDIENYKRKY